VSLIEALGGANRWLGAAPAGIRSAQMNPARPERGPLRSLARRTGRWGLLVLALSVPIIQALTLYRTFQFYRQPSVATDRGGRPWPVALFYYDRAWQASTSRCVASGEREA